MTLCRTIHKENYSTVNNTIIKDNRLSWKAKGIWLYAFSRPDDWIFYVADIIKQSTDGRDAVKAGLKELEEAGYLLKYQKKNKDGTWGEMEWIFYETPEELKKSLPQTENPLAVNRPLLSTDNKISTESIGTLGTASQEAIENLKPDYPDWLDHRLKLPFLKGTFEEFKGWYQSLSDIAIEDAINDCRWYQGEEKIEDHRSLLVERLNNYRKLYSSKKSNSSKAKKRKKDKRPPRRDLI
jgi:hypothetical protein